MIKTNDPKISTLINEFGKHIQRLELDIETKHNENKLLQQKIKNLESPNECISDSLGENEIIRLLETRLANKDNDMIELEHDLKVKEKLIDDINSRLKKKENDILRLTKKIEERNRNSGDYISRSEIVQQTKRFEEEIKLFVAKWARFNSFRDVLLTNFDNFKKVLLEKHILMSHNQELNCLSEHIKNVVRL